MSSVVPSCTNPSISVPTCSSSYSSSSSSSASSSNSSLTHSSSTSKTSYSSSCSSLVSDTRATITTPTHVGIIGTACRKEDGPKMTRAVFESMCTRALQVMFEEWKLPRGQVALVSGGAAGADHVAVALWLRHRAHFASLTLCLPAPWTGAEHSIKYPDGKHANALHRAFSSRIGHKTSSLTDIGEAIKQGATIRSYSGFASRNMAVARSSNYVVAFTWGTDPEKPKEGGTRQTWNLCRGVRHHVPLGTLVPSDSLSSSTSTGAR